jgi:tripeptide aminopeptidase
VSRALETFLDLVRISSPTGRERGVAEYVVEALRAAGCEVRVDDTTAQTGADTGNVIATLPGSLPGPVVALCAHMDCVQPCEDVVPVVVEGVVRSAGDTVLGGDDKVGVAAILEVMQRLAGSDEPRVTVKAVLTVSEEEGLKGAKALASADAAAGLCLVLDGDGPVGGIVTAAPTHYTFAASFIGRAAHAGVEPEKGVSAITMAADAIGRMALGRIDEITTANIGTIAGGSATNVVAPTCTVTGECRSRARDRVERVREAMDAAMRAAAHDAGGTVEVSWTLEYEGFTLAPDDPAVALVAAACADVGVEPRLFATGGGSDANVLAALGVPTLVLSCGMTKVHTVDEELPVADLDRLVDLLGAVVRRAAS